MAFYGYNDDFGECNWTPSDCEFYNSSSYYDSSVTRSQLNYSVYDIHEPDLTQYEPIQYYENVPNLIPYEPIEYYDSTSNYYDGFESRFDTNYSVYSYSEPKLVHGGCDPSANYGSPLPSDQICYPRSTSQSKGAALEGLSYNSIPSPYGENDKQIAIKINPQPQGENVDKIALDGVGSEKVGELPDP
ncbi:unnamed protein product [Fraxinus pennsylvanica]|uniref:Uncharacterized protein n=1 Tax=Fraxinus pennsylvanica TaxID=56036 RepID=A0AAD1YTU7_9LAMI|nr:unnamed protein product [Fraxinus pennsylvanica]